MLTDDERLRQVRIALMAAAAGDADRATEAMNRIGENSDYLQMFAVCCCFAQAAKGCVEQMSGQKIGGDTILAIEDLTPDGQHDPADMFAVRFVAAYANGDRDHAFALFQASCKASMEEHVDSVLHLLGLAGNWARLLGEHMKEQAGLA